MDLTQEKTFDFKTYEFPYRGLSIRVKATADFTIRVWWEDFDQTFLADVPSYDPTGEKLRAFAIGVYEAHVGMLVPDAIERLIRACEDKVQGTLITTITYCPQTKTISFKYIGNETVQL